MAWGRYYFHNLWVSETERAQGFIVFCTINGIPIVYMMFLKDLSLAGTQAFWSPPGPQGLRQRIIRNTSVSVKQEMIDKLPRFLLSLEDASYADTYINI